MTIYTHLIYKHTSPSGKSYIGQTNDYDRRCKEHQKYTWCRAFSAAIQKYGWDNFTHEMLVEYITEDEANALEVYYIKEHSTLYPNGYNLTTGGDASLPSAETRSKMSIAQQGKKLTQESIDKRTASQKAKSRTLSPNHKDKMTEGRKKSPLSADAKKQISETLKLYHQSRRAQ
jgi:group I intron endonuclease